ncbi:CbiX/SirB N-terminal domain-containing protein [Scytonema sp. NUACC21]
MLSAYLLVSHGSHDPRPEIAMQHLAGLLSRKVQSYLSGMANSFAGCSYEKSLIGTAYLELNSEPLHEQVKRFGNNAVALGCRSLKILPLFLLPGVHVMEDIPAEISQAEQSLDENIKIHIQPYLGSHPGLGALLAKQLAPSYAGAKILLAHGSRRPGSQQAVEAIAASLGAVAAYWTHPSSLKSRVQELVIAGYCQIAILPYFLFTGGITDAIALQQEELKLLFPGVSFQLAEPLGASAELADVIWELMEK